MKNSEKYWREREEEARKKHIKEEAEYRKYIEKIYREMCNEISDQIFAFYAKYLSEEGISLAKVKEKCRKLDIKDYEEKAKKYVKEKDFSDEANAEMKIYNLTMKVNRLELLKAQLGLELVAGTDEIEKFLKKELEGRTIEELEKQAGILGHSLIDNKRLANSIVNASFYNATFSDRIWANQENLKFELDKILKTALIQGRNPREFIPRIRKAFDVSVNQAYRLLVTELARVQTDAQMKSFKKNGFDQFTFHALGTACDLCLELNGKHFNIEDGEFGKNLPPTHPHCRCSTSAYMDDEDYEKWLDGYKEHGLTWEEWRKEPKQIEMYRRKEYTHRKTSGNGGKIIDKALYNRITKPAIKAGADIRIADEQWKKHLQKQQASAVTIGDIIIFNEDATVSDVLEEVHHFYQNKKGMNNHLRNRERTILNEIDAKRYLLLSAKKYKIPLEEIELTKRQLASYMKEMEELKRVGEWHENN